MKLFASPLIKFTGVIAMGLISAKAFACPDYLKGEYRKLHSKESINLCKLTENKTVLIVNTASHCGYTSQFKSLEALHQKYKDKGLVVVGFASDDFNQEAKDESEAAGICFLNYGVTFTMLSPTHVKGDEANTVFKALAEKSEAPGWNFNKYLLGEDGKTVKHFASRVKPDSADLAKEIEKQLIEF